MASDPLVRSTVPPQNDCLGRTCLKGQRNGELSGADLQLIVDRLVEMDEEGVEWSAAPWNVTSLSPPRRPTPRPAPDSIPPWRPLP
jgi:hypothetical protein